MAQLLPLYTLYNCNGCTRVFVVLLCLEERISIILHVNLWSVVSVIPK